MCDRITLYLCRVPDLKLVVVAVSDHERSFRFVFFVSASANNFAKAGIFDNLADVFFVFNLSGAMTFQELIQTGGTQERRQLQELQGELQSDDPINIQFTSVSYIFNTPS